jgi:hypothetical protein
MGSWGSSSSLGRRAILASSICLALLAVIAPAAVADSVLCESGSGADACSNPKGAAVDHTEDLLYIADDGNLRVDVFEVDGTFLRAFGWNVAPDAAPGDTASDQFEICTTSCQAGSSGAGPGQFKALSGIAIDNDPASTAFRDVYVFDRTNGRLQRFHPSGEFVGTFGTPGGNAGQFGSSDRIALGPGGIVHVGGQDAEGRSRVQKFNHLGELIGVIPLVRNECDEGKSSNLVPVNSGIPGLAVDSGGNFYVAFNGAEPPAIGTRKYGPGGDLFDGCIPIHRSLNIQTITLSGDDSLFVGDSTGSDEGGETAIYEYNSGGVLFRVFYGDGTLRSRPISLVPYGTDGVFAVEGLGARRVLHVSFPDPGPVVHPDPNLTKAIPIASTWAVLNTRINPEGKGSTYRFEYVDDATCQEDIDDLGPGHCFDRAMSTTEASLALGTTPSFAPPLFRLSMASAQVGCLEPENPPQVSCLTPETVYHFRAVAKNPDGENTGPESSFETRISPEILDTWSTNVGVDSAFVHAEVDPVGIPASGRFEYVEEAAYLKDLAELGPGHGFDHAASSDPIDFGSGEGPTVRGVQLHSLKPGTAYRYRVVVENSFRSAVGPERSFKTFLSPSGPKSCPNDSFRTGLSAHLPDCRVYEMVSPVDKEGGEIAVNSIHSGVPAEHNQSAAEVPAGGRGLTYSSNRAFGDSISAPFTSQYMASRHLAGDPEEGWRSHGISPRREGRNFLVGLGPGLDTQYKAFSEDLRYGWLRSDSEPPLESEPPLPIPGFANLYRRENESETYEAICPVEPPKEEREAYVPEPQGFSADGGTTVFRANDKLTTNASSKKGIYQLYGCAEGNLRLISMLPSGNASGNNSSAGTRLGTRGDHREDSLHNAVSADASRVYWTDSGAAERDPGKIYLRENPFSEEAECASATAPCTTAVSASVGGAGSSEPALFWTAATDGGRAIFSFTQGPLVGNLYEFGASGAKPAELIAAGVLGVVGASEDATRVYFVSTKAVAAGAQAGKANLYLHEAGKGGGPVLVAVLPAVTNSGNCIVQQAPFRHCTRSSADGEWLVFMSADPLTGYDNTDAVSGKADTEVFLYDASAKAGAAQLLCVSCNPSGGRPAGQAQIPPWANSFYAPRLLSADGRRLFFESFDALVPQDTNGALDVYQWQEAGKGTCDTADHDYFAQNGGCLGLISSGKSPRDSSFLDASADGSDVFIKTAASLLPQDPGLIDIYDARIGGGFPLPPDPKPPCEGEACQSPPAPPQASAPSSSAFSGPGNPKPRCPKGKRRVRRAGKVRCLKPKKGKQRRRRAPQRGVGR